MSQRGNDPGGPNDFDKAQRVDEFADAYLRSLQLQPVQTSWREIVDRHPELAPELERRLRFVESVFLAIQPNPSAGSGGTDDPTAFVTVENGNPDGDGARQSISRDRVISIRCPQCGNMLKVVTHGETEVTCGSCGSAVSVDPDGTRTDTQVRTPKFIAHFKIISVLGQGAFGTAYKAEDTRLNRHVAIKVPRAGNFTTTNDELRFIREARHAAQLRHPNIVQVHEIANDHGVPYLVSDFIDGITLSDLISGRRLTYRESAEMMITIGDAVQFAHEHHVIHRDLKPSNILLDASNNPHVADFGLARQTEGEFTVTLEGEILGTPAYMSPEQAAGKEVDVRTDVYSLGVMLYRLVCGELPFRGSQRMMIHQVLHDDPRAPRNLDERVPRDLDTVILKAMAKERERRYQTAREFAADLRCWLSSQPISARPVGVWGKTIRWCRRNPKGALAAAGTTLLLLTIAGISTGWAIRERALREVRIQAAKNRVDADRRSVEVLNNNGLQHLQANDPFAALPFFSQALGVESRLAQENGSKANIDNVQLQRLRLGLVQQSLPKLLRVWDLKGKIQGLKFSSDGKILFAATRKGAVLVIDPDHDDPLVLQRSNDIEIWHSDMDPTGVRAVTTSSDKRSSLWDVQNGSHVAFLTHEDRVVSANFSSNGKWVATASDDNDAGLWNAKDGVLVARLNHPGKYVSRTKFSPDSKTLLTVSRANPESDCEINVWDLDKREKRIPGLTYPATINTVAFDKTGERIFAGCNDGSIAIWNAISGQQTSEPLRQESSVDRLFFADDGHTLVAVSHEGTVTFWDLAKRFKRDTAIRTTVNINDVDVDPDANFIALANGDLRTRVFWQFCGQPLGAEIPHGGHPQAIAFHPNGRGLAIGGDDGMVRLWDLASMAPANDVIRCTEDVTSVAYSDQGRRLLVTSRDSTARQWNATTFRPIGSVMQHDDDVVYGEYAALENYIVTASADKTAQIWDAITGKPVGPRLQHSSPVVRARFIPGTDRLITLTDDGTGAIWTIGSDHPLHRFNQNTRLVRLDFHPDGKSFAASGEGSYFQIRRCEDGSPIGKPIQHDGLVYDPRFSQSGSKIISASFSGSIAVSDLDNDTYPSIRWNLPSGIFVAQFVRGDNSVLTGDIAGELMLWNQVGTTYVPRWSAVDPTVEINRAVVHPSLPIIVSTGNRSLDAFQPGVGVIRVHDLEYGTLLASTRSHFRKITELQMRPDGMQIMSGSEDGTVRLWDLVLDDRPVSEIQHLANFFNGFSVNEQTQRRPMNGQAQVAEFRALRKKYADTFSSSEAEIQRWAEEVQWVRDYVAKHKK